VVGPASSISGHLATFADATGKLIQDGGPPAVPFGSCNFAPTVNLGSVYQNTGAQTLWLSVSFLLTSSAAAEVEALVGPANPPTNYVANLSHGLDGLGLIVPIDIMVPPSYYFEFHLDTGTALISDKVSCTSSGIAGGGGGPTTQTATSNTPDGTVYQNTGTTPRYVNFSWRCQTGAGDAYAMTNRTNSLINPANIVSLQNATGPFLWSLSSFIVLPGWYYSITTETCTPNALQFWIEWN
jgi:hypothetical protein